MYKVLAFHAHYRNTKVEFGRFSKLVDVEIKISFVKLELKLKWVLRT
jgi:hypothetical protein